MKEIKQSKGITMITLIITIIVILIILGVTIYESVENIKARKIDLLYSDLELLEDKVNTYYLNNGTIPIKEEFKGSENFKTVRNVNDNNVYYVIDISSLDGVSLNMKLDFTGDDVYIMNEKSHTVYYPKGLTIDNETYYTLPKYYTKIEDKDDTGEGSIVSPTQIQLSGISISTEGLYVSEGEFTFVIKDDANNEVSSGTNYSDGNIIFSPVIIDEPGTYQFTVSQVVSNMDGILYDDSVYTIIVRVTDSGGQLNADIKYYDEEMNEVEKIEFVNKYGEPEAPEGPDTTKPYILGGGGTFIYDGTSHQLEITVRDNESGIARIMCDGQ